jgi:hypothetical protein
MAHFQLPETAQAGNLCPVPGCHGRLNLVRGPHDRDEVYVVCSSAILGLKNLHFREATSEEKFDLIADR